jgi:hypothetical protein
MPELEKDCEAWQHDMTTCQDLPFRYKGVRSVCGPEMGGVQWQTHQKTEKIFMGRVDAHLFPNGHFAPIYEV